MRHTEENNDVFVAADSAMQARDYQSLWDLRDRLRETDLWSGGYGPVCAIAGWYVDQAAADTLLDELIDDGFHQPEIFTEEFAHTFATEAGWSDRLRRMKANVPPPPIELLDWPDYPPTLEPVLDRLEPEREAELATRLPDGGESAWHRAVALLDWVTTRWVHANAHVERRDAVELLDRVDAGEQFACVEYTIVLSQALNAAGLPARSLNLLMRDHHAGASRGHVVSEAWIDDLEKWVLLDGQNGAWWGDPEPLGVLELMQRYAEGSRPPMHSHHHDLDDAQQDLWFSYFANAKTTGLAWTDNSFVPIFQTHNVVETERLVHDQHQVAPSLARIATAVADADGPALCFTPTHPYATGVEVCGDGGSTPTRVEGGGMFSLSGLPVGTHDYQVATVTPYATLSPSPLRVVVR